MTEPRAACETPVASPPRRPFWRSPLIGLVCSAVLLGLLATQVDLRASLAELRRVDLARLWAPALFLALGLSVRPWRWQLIFPPHARPAFGRSFSVWSIANMCNNILPARGGDVLRCFLIAGNGNQATTSVRTESSTRDTMPIRAATSVRAATVRERVREPGEPERRDDREGIFPAEPRPSGRGFSETLASREPAALATEGFPINPSLTVGARLGDIAPSGDIAPTGDTTRSPRAARISVAERIGGAGMALATLGLEKVLDGLALLAVVALSFAFLKLPGWLASLALIALAVFGGALLVMIALALRPKAIYNAIAAIGRKLGMSAAADRVIALLDKFADGLAAVRSPRQMFVLIVLTALTWALDMALVWSCAAVVGAPISPWVGALLTAVLGLGLMIPAAPGYIGTYEFFSVGVLSLFAVSPEQALALTLVMHAGVLLMTTLFGLAALGVIGVRWSVLLGGRKTPPMPLKEAAVHGR